jgi:hypothetical protein
MKSYENKIYSFLSYSLYYEKANLIWRVLDDVYHLISAIFLTLSVYCFQEEDDTTSRPEKHAQKYEPFDWLSREPMLSK